MRFPCAHRVLTLSLLGHALLLLCSGCAQSESAREEQAMKAAIPQRLQPDGTIKLTDADRTALDLATARATEDELPEVAVRFGRVRATLGGEILVVSPVAGRISRAPPVQLGASVKPAAALLDIVPVLSASDRISVNVRGAELRGQIESARRELATQEAALDRARALASSKIVSEAKLQEVETSVETTRARLDALQRAAHVQSTGEGAPVTLRAPSSGTVATLNASLGAVVQQGDVLVRILRPGPRWVDVSVAPSEPVGQRYEVAVGATWLPARLIAAGALAETEGSRRDRLQVDGPAAAQLVPGQTVAVRVARGVARGIVLPAAAIVPGVETDLVFVETSAGKYAPRPVQVAARFGGRVRLVSGVRAGEDVVIRGAMSLQGESRRRELTHVE
jgi:biotin carboxyl carrier protein